MALQYVLTKTLEICLAAVKQNRAALAYVPANMRESIANTKGMLGKIKGLFGFGRRTRRKTSKRYR